jgi:hypothetical protein
VKDGTTIILVLSAQNEDSLHRLKRLLLTVIMDGYFKEGVNRCVSIGCLVCVICGAASPTKEGLVVSNTYVDFYAQRRSVGGALDLIWRVFGEPLSVRVL